MNHVVEITCNGMVDLRPGGKASRLERLKLETGEVLCGEVRSYCADLGWDRLIEKADIDLADGTGTLLAVPCSSFRFLDN